MSQKTGLSIFGDTLTAELHPVAGWTFAYNVNADIVNTALTGDGSVTHSDAMAILSTTAASASSARISTKRPLRYLPGLGGIVRFTVIYSPPVVGSKQLIGLGTTENGFLMGYIDTDFVVVRLSDSVENSIPSDKFNFPAMPEVDFTKGNVFVVRYQWLGFGPIIFAIEVPDQVGNFEPFHIIKYPNTAIVPSVLNPTMPVTAYVENTTNDSNIVLKTSSSMAFREGAYIPATDPLTLIRSFEGSATITTEVPILAVRAKTTYQSVTNLISPLVGAFSFVTDGTKSVIFRIYRGGSLTGASWSDFNTNTSSLESDTSASALSNGVFVFAYDLAKIDSKVDKIEDWNLVLEPGEILTITAQSAGSNDVNVTVLMEEPF